MSSSQNPHHYIHHLSDVERQMLLEDDLAQRRATETQPAEWHEPPDNQQRINIVAQQDREATLEFEPRAEVPRGARVTATKLIDDEVQVIGSQSRARSRHVTSVSQASYRATASADIDNHHFAPVSQLPGSLMVGPTQDDEMQEFDDNHMADVPAIDSWMTQNIVQMYIGPNRQKWGVHEQLLASKSPFLKQVLEQNALKGCTEIVLTDADPKLFAMLLRWMYSTAFANSGGNRVFRYPIPDGVRYTVSDFLGLYVLGGQLEIIGVKNAAIDAVYAYYAEGTDEPRCPNLRDVQMIFDNTPEDSHMRRLLIAHSLFYLFNAKRQGIPSEWEEVMVSSGQIGWSMIQMLADWNWSMGNNVPPMRIKTRQAFHEPVPIDMENVKMEEDQL